MPVRSPRQRANFVRLLRKYLVGRDGANLADLIEDSHPADIAQILERFDMGARVVFFKILPPSISAEVWQELSMASQQGLLDHLEDEDLAPILNALPADELVDLLAELSRDRARSLLPRLDDTLAIRKLLRYTSDTAGGRMTTEFIAFPADTSSAECIADLRERQDEAETIYYIYVVDQEGRLEGTLSLRDLLAAQPDEPLGDIMTSNIISVSPDADQSEVVEILGTYGLLAVPVVDQSDVLLGIVTVDDAFEILDDERGEELALTSGLIVRRPGRTVPIEDLAEADWRMWPRRALAWFALSLAGALVAFAAGTALGLEQYRGEMMLLAATVLSFVTASRGTGLVWLWSRAGSRQGLWSLALSELSLSLVAGLGAAAGLVIHARIGDDPGLIWAAALLLQAPVVGALLSVVLAQGMYRRAHQAAPSFLWLLIAVVLLNAGAYVLLTP